MMLTLATAALLAAATAAPGIAGLRCEYAVDPLGLGATRPRLSWALVSTRRGEQQTAYQVLVAATEEALARNEGNLWDSGRVASDRSVHVPYAGVPLVSRQRAVWKVRVWDDDGRETAWSPVARFEMGLLRPSDWSARWIGRLAPETSPDSPPATYLHREFPATRPVRRARVYASAKGLYELFLNGVRVGEDYFRPGWTDYRDRFQVQTYDVGPLLREGRNAIGVVLGDGWYAGHVADRGRENWGRSTRALVQLELEYDDGTQARVVSDASWKAGEGPIRSSDLLMGEIYDARREIAGWAEPGFDATGWRSPEVEALGSVPLVPQVGPSVRRVAELNPQELTQPSPGVHVYDLGQNMVGFVRLRVSGPAGTTVRLRHAEMLNPDGSIYTANLRSARATDTYTIKGGGLEVWEPTFTYHGFRYVEVTGYPGIPRPDAVTGVVLSSALDATGVLQTSDDLVNQLQHNIVWGQRGNYLEVPTDCPQRDERLGWMGDAQVFARTACFNFDVASFLTKWLQDVRDAQSPDGGFPNFAPVPGKKEGGSPAWGDAGVMVPWTLYRCYGDKRVLEQQYDAMKRWIAYVRDANPDLLWVKRSDANFGDWLNVGADAPRDVLATAYFARSTRLVAKTARVLRREEEAREFERLFGRIRDAFDRAYLKPDGRIEGDTQTIYLLALAFDLLPEERRPRAAECLVEDIVEKRHGHLSTGFLGVSLLNPVLTRIGRTDLAYRLLLEDTYPSWGYSIRQGATTIWERWDGWTEDKGFQDPGMNSFNHYSLGSVGQWLYAVVAGIDLDPEEPGYQRIILQPRPGGGLTHAEGALRTLYGRIRSAWRIESGRLRWDVEVPPNTTAEIHVPTCDPESVTEGGRPAAEAEGLTPIGPAVFEAGSGRYFFEAWP
jgi:alpha-L-rhamnosidase